MSKILAFGAGGKAGRAAIAEAHGRGHQVTAVVREPAKYADLATDSVRVIGGDVTDAHSVATVAVGHDAVISAVYDPTATPDLFYVSSTHALLDGLALAGVGRLLLVGMAGNLETSPGVRVMDAPDFPAEHLPFALGHTAGLHALRAAATELNWLMVSPALVLDANAPRTGRYRIAGDQLVVAEDGTSHISYADLAVALLDEIDAPKHHRTRIAVGD